MQYRADIDGLRAVAIVPVVLFHAGLGFHGGFVGVDIFFVISGYLLSSIVIQEISEKRFSFLQFYERRFRRLAPAFMAMLAATYVAFACVMLPEDFEALGRSALGAIFFYANLHFYSTIDYFSQSADLMPLLHMWSLSIEEQFYLLLPVTVLILLRVCPRRWLPALLGLGLLGSFALCIHYTNAYRPYGFYMPHTRAWELLAGTLLAALPRLPGSQRSANILGTLALAAIAVALFTFDEDGAFPGWIAAIPVLATVALIHGGGVAPHSWPARLLALPPFVFIGRISYSLYLWHWPVIVLVRYADLSPDSRLVQIGCVLVSVALATLSWAIIEEPVRRRRVLASQGAVYAGAAVSALAMALVAGVLIWRDGVPGRVPDTLRDMLEQARLEESRVTPCFFREARVARTADPCLRGAPGQAPGFILIGDSHANALSPGLFAAAEAEGLAGMQFTAPGAFPGPGMWRIGANRTDARTARMMTVLAAHPEIDTVIVAAAWSHYFLGENWKGMRSLFQDDQATARTLADNAEIVARALTRLIEALPGRRIILLDDVPGGLQLDLNFFGRRSVLRGLDPGGAVLPHDTVAALRAAHVPHLEAIAAAHDRVEFLPVFAGFCTGPDGCPLFAPDGVTPMYLDGDHLSAFAARSWAPVFRQNLWP